MLQLLFRYSGTYTAEEAVLLARNKMMRLQMLYQKQFDKILTTLKEKRRNYLAAIKKEKETLCKLIHYLFFCVIYANKSLAFIFVFSN